MSEEEKEAIELLKERKATKPYIIWGKGIPYNKSNKIDTILNLIDKLQKENVKKDNVIDLMAEDIYDNDNFWKLKCAFEKVEKGKEKDYIKEYFYKKAEEEK